jgi:hypothetical protein
MKNPWENFSLDIYEKHMRLPEVSQLQALNKIMHSQLSAYSVTTAAIFGIAGGNGLEHIENTDIRKVYGIDVNRDYLTACGKRYGYLGSKLELLNIDLTDITVKLPDVRFVIADLVIEYIGIRNFSHHISRIKPEYVSCVIQKNTSTAFVSVSPYKKAFAAISELHKDIKDEELTTIMKDLQYDIVLKDSYPLPNGKVFFRLDYKKLA